MNPFKSKKGLGRGLSSLIGDSKINSTNNKLLISDVVRSKLQPRKNFDKQYLEDLTNSIKERGVVQPIIVRKSKDISGKYEIIAGERRWLASQNAGLNEIPSIIIEADDLKSLEFAIVENVQRHDLNPIEEANGYKKLMDDFGYDQDKVAKFIGKSRAHIANCLRLLSLPDNVIQLVETNKLSQGHAKILVGLENCFVIAKKIIDKKLSVRQSENLVRLFKNKSNRKISLKSANIKDLENILKDKLGIRVLINNKKNNRGSISFEYKDLDQLNRIIEIIKSNY
ncbi:ParB/RepB/Spo0J family partition protein [Candidatus Pelagibacter communis]|uniref:ParB/RepB/Spo0J family partition protein n=1 Tax=Pelagibacter ubique TaxID=198252 RepID=UPI00094DA1DE|nr:ParB/RepB/Spo0J family partition protein [Candidatus Pelagibacter ubique]